MHGTTEPQRVPPKYTGAIASGIVTAGAAAIALIWVTAYAASPNRPAVTPGITAIAALTGSVGATIIIVAIALRIFMAELTEMRNDRIGDKADTDAKLAAIKKAVDDHGENVLVDHMELHDENVKNEQQIGLLIDASTRVLAYEEQRAHLRVEDHRHIGELRQQVADLSLDYGKQLEELAQRHKELTKSLAGIGTALDADRLEAIVIEAIRKAYTNGYTDALDGRPPQAPGNVRRLPPPDQR